MKDIEGAEYENAVALTYFAFTTLSTIGLGDYHPKSNFERLLGAMVLFGGVLTFSYIMGNFLIILDNWKLVHSENEDAANLSRFFGLMKKFNNNTSLKKDHMGHIQRFFDFYWDSDRRSSIQTEQQ